MPEQRQSGTTPATGEAALRLRLLGPVRAWRGDQELDLGSARRRLVLAILALRANQVVSREELVDGVWGDSPPAKAVDILYTYIWGLRQALEPPRRKQDPPTVLTSPGSGYSLRLDTEQIDEQLFTRYHHTAQRHWERGELRPTRHALEAALSLWQGEALAGLAGPVAELHRTRLGELRLAASERLAELKIIEGDSTAAIADLRELVAEHPLRERSLALLMTALYRGGRPDEALTAFTSAQDHLVAELGIEPSPAVQRIRTKIQANEPVTPRDFQTGGTPPPAPGTGDGLEPRLPAPPAPPAVLVGRTRELTWLQSLLAGLASGRGGCWWVEGEPGIGKSALLAAALAALPPGRYRTAWLVGEELVGQVPLLDRSSAIDPYLIGVDRTPALVERLCADAPLVIVVDEFENTDDTGRLLWRRLTRLTQQLPLVLVGACRTFPHEAGLERSRDAVTAVGGHAVTLGPLDAVEVTDLTTRRLGVQTSSALGEYLDEALGNPRYLNELLDLVLDSGVPPKDVGVAVEPSPGLRSNLTAALTRMVIRRLGCLTPATREVLRWAALLGARFDLGQVATVMRASSTDLIAAVEEATTARVLVDTDRGLDFRSNCIRRALYEEQIAPVRVALHREAAGALATSGAPVEVVAAQLLAAAPAFDPWVVRWLLANTDALGARDPLLAVDLLEQAMSVSLISDQDREQLAVRQVRWLFYLGRNPEAEARAVLSTTTDAEHAAEMRWILSHLVQDVSQLRTALANLQDAQQDPSVPDFWKARYKSLQARFERTWLDDLGKAWSTAFAALDQAKSTADPVAMSEALQELWYLETVRRDHGAALAHVDRALAATAGEPGLVRWQLHLLDNRAFTLQNLDRLDEASEVLARTRALSNHVRPRAGRYHVATAVHSYWLGRWDEALAELEILADHNHQAEFFDLRPQAPLLQYGVAALIAAQRGDTGALRSHLHAAAAYPPAGLGDQENSDFLVVARAIDAGQRAGADAELAGLDVLLDLNYGRTTLRHQWLPTIVRLALDADDRTRVKAALEVSEIEAAQETPAARARTALTWCQGLVGRDTAALLAVARHHGDVGRPVEMAAALVDAAAVMAWHGETDPAEDTFSQALTMLTELGATFDIDRAITRMKKLGVHHDNIRAGQPVVTGWHSLSELERRVAELAAEGMTNPQIAAELTISRRDVHSHLSRVILKLGAGSRKELAEMMTTAAVTTRTDAEPPTATGV